MIRANVIRSRTLNVQEQIEKKAGSTPRRVQFGLSWKLLGLTAIFVMVSEVLIYVPSIANFRVSWLNDRLATASAASVVLNAPDLMEVPQEIQDELLEVVGAQAIVIRGAGVSRPITSDGMPPKVDKMSDLRVTSTFGNIADAIDTLINGGAHRMLSVVDETPNGNELELILNEGELHTAMVAYSVNTLWMSLIISIVTGALVFLALNRLFVRPMRRMSQNMVTFTERPEDEARIIEPSRRRDEIGVAEERLAGMEHDLSTTLQNQKRLADLGLAVSKIVHDLRNMLASAQLLSDRISAVPDPSVQRFAPKLIAALDRAIAFAQSTLAYGKPREAAPERRLVRLYMVVEDVGQVLGLEQKSGIQWVNRVAPDLEIDADPDQLFRVLMNLCRNAVDAMEGEAAPSVVQRLTLDAKRAGSVVTITVADTGPGLPQRAAEHLFQPFHGAGRAGGTGLGLAISAELVKAHGGTIELQPEAGPGTSFEITIPDRPIDFAKASSRAASAG
jgi:signal transduction histidine kinase